LFFSKEKPFRMIWRVEKNDNRGFLAGTAHFFPHSFNKSFHNHLRKVRVVLFEGPMDDQNFSRVIESGRLPEANPSLLQALSPEALQKIKDLLAPPNLPRPSFPLLILRSGTPWHVPLQSMKPWMAFLHIWSQYLKTRGWNCSVDLEALRIASKLGKEIHFLESIDEQIAALEEVSFERIVHFLNQAHRWDEYTQRHRECYLKGDLQTLMSSILPFPTRCESIVEKRDPVLFQRMKDFFRQGGVMAFMGTAHIPGLRKMFEQEGYRVAQEPE
jgi:uncharacterized protein YbaP (TraB family)